MKLPVAAARTVLHHRCRYHFSLNINSISTFSAKSSTAMAATSTQYQATKQGGPFAIVSVPQPIPEAHEVCIRMKAVGLNPIDPKQLYYGLYIESWPTILGADGAGVVEAVGEGVTKFKAGDDVIGVFGGGPKGAAFQEIATLPEIMVAKKPSNLSFEEAASLTICYITAASGIYGSLKIPLPFLSGGSTTGEQPQSVLVLGGSSGVGASAIQILRLALPSATILTTSSPQHHARLTSLGATKAFDQRSASLVEDVKSATPDGSGVDAIFDAVGSGATQTSIFNALRADGSKEYAAVVTGPPFPVPEHVTKYDVFGQAVFQTQGGSNILSALSELVSQGKFKIPVRVETVGSGFEAIGKGLEQLNKGVSGTKLVVTI